MTAKFRLILFSLLLLTVIAVPVIAQDGPTDTLISTQFNVVEEAE